MMVASHMGWVYASGPQYLQVGFEDEDGTAEDLWWYSLDVRADDYVAMQEFLASKDAHWRAQAETLRAMGEAATAALPPGPEEALPPSTAEALPACGALGAGSSNGRRENKDGGKVNVADDVEDLVYGQVSLKVYCFVKQSPSYMEGKRTDADVVKDLVSPLACARRRLKVIQGHYCESFEAIVFVLPHVPPSLRSSRQRPIGPTTATCHHLPTLPK